MKCVVTDAQGLKLGGIHYARGEIVEILGAELRELFAGRIMAIEDQVLVRELQIGSHPLYVTRAGVWGRKPYAVGDIVWMPTRMHAKMVADWTRPATGGEVLAAVVLREGKAPPAAPEPREPTPIGTAAAADGPTGPSGAHAPPRRRKRRRAKRSAAASPSPSQPAGAVDDAVQREIDQKLAAIGVTSTRT